MIKHHLHTIAIVASLLLASAQIASASEPWPATDATGTQIAFYSDASGIVYQERLGTFFIVTNAGCVKQINNNGTQLSSFCSSEWLDFEGITVADSNSDYLYLGLESPQKIYEFDISDNALTGKTWTLSGMSVATGAGLEALEYVDGYFYAGSQNNGKVYVYSVNLSASGSATLMSSFYPYSGYITDLAALHYSGETDMLYSLYDSGNRLVVTKGDGTYMNRYQLPIGTTNEEGFVAVPNCPNSTTDIVMTEDSGRIMRFSGFTIDINLCPVSTPEPEPTIEPLPEPILEPTSESDPEPIPESTPEPTPETTPEPEPETIPEITPEPEQESESTSESTPAPTPGPTPEPEPTPTYSAVEYLNNGIDDDGDGVIDEWNTLAAPGVHPVYGSYDASSTSLYASTVTSIAGASNGAIKVKFADGSGYRYTVFSVTTSRVTKVSSPDGTAYLLVKNVSGRKTALVNAYTGAISDTIIAAKGSAVSIHWKTLTLHHK